MVNALLNGIFTFVTGLINLITAPFDSVINSYFPDFTQVIGLFNSFIDFVIQFFTWILSWFNIPPYLIAFACLLVIAKILTYLTFTPIKLGLKWWHVIVP